MTYWVWWHGANGEEAARVLGPFGHRKAAEAALLKQARVASAALEHGTGKAGSYALSPDRQIATLYRDDWLDEIPLGRYIIERDTPAKP